MKIGQPLGRRNSPSACPSTRTDSPLSACTGEPQTAETQPMAKARGDFTDILVRRQVLSPDQLDEARGLERQAGMKLHDAIVKLGYATTDQVMSAVAEHHGMQFVDLADMTIPPAVIELVPESVARENI